MYGDSLHENAMLRAHDRAADRSANARIFEHKPPPARRAQAHRPYADSRHQTDAAHDRRLPGSDEPCPGGVVMAKGGETHAHSLAGASMPRRYDTRLADRAVRPLGSAGAARRSSTLGCSDSELSISRNRRGSLPPYTIHDSAGSGEGPNSGG